VTHALPSALLALVHDEAVGWNVWNIHPSVAIGCALLAGAYLYAVGPLRRRRGWAPRFPRARAAAFLAGIAVLFVSLNGPLHDLSDGYLFSAHMAQHMLLMMVMAPLLVLGLPGWLVRSALARPGVERAARFLTHPAVAYVAYNVILIGWHFPAAYGLALENHDVHIVQHLLFMAVAVMMWWPIVEPVRELRRIERPVVLLYVFAFGIPMSVLSAFITMSDTVLYQWYAEAPRITSLDPLSDQQLGGLIMWVPGMIIFWTAVGAVFLRWANREETKDGRQPGWTLRRRGPLRAAGKSHVSDRGAPASAP
jgi:putative membrane protein